MLKKENECVRMNNSQFYSKEYRKTDFDTLLSDYIYVGHSNNNNNDKNNNNLRYQEKFHL